MRVTNVTAYIFVYFYSHYYYYGGCIASMVTVEIHRKAVTFHSWLYRIAFNGKFHSRYSKKTQSLY